MLPRQSIQVLDLKIQKKKSEKTEKKEKIGLTMPDKKKLMEILQGGQPNPEKDPTLPTVIKKAKKIKLEEEVPAEE